MDTSQRRQQWISWDEPPEGGIYTRDHIDPSFAYMGYKMQIMDLYELANSIHLAWDYCFQSPQRPYIDYVGKFLTESGNIDDNSTKNDILYEFSRINPERTKH